MPSLVIRELVVRAALHRARLGDPGGVPAARLLGEAIDNPALHAELANAVRAHEASAAPPVDHTHRHTLR